MNATVAEKRRTSEQRYGVIAQPAETCPLIDKCIAAVDDALKAIKGYERADEDDMRRMLDTVERELGDLIGYRYNGWLEEIRAANTGIRAWGEGWKEIALEHAPEPEEEPS